MNDFYIQKDKIEDKIEYVNVCVDAEVNYTDIKMY